MNDLAALPEPTPETSGNTNGSSVPKTKARKPRGHGDLQLVSLDLLRAHPRNPRLVLNAEVVAGIAAQLRASGQFHPSHAVVARPVGAEYQLVEGHHRVEAARAAELKEVPCWVREMDDHEALLALGLANNQGELSGLEIGLHALDVVAPARGQQGLGLKAYSERMGVERSTLVRYRLGAEVFRAVSNLVGNPHCLRSKALHLAEIHRVDPSGWLDLVRACIDESWSVKDAADRVRAILKPVPAEPEARSEAPTTMTAAGVGTSASEGVRPEAASVATITTTAVTTAPEGAPAAGPNSPPSTPADSSGSSPSSTEAVLQEEPGVEIERGVWKTAGYGSEVDAVEEPDGSYILHVELPSTRVILRLVPSDTGVLLRVEPVPVEGAPPPAIVQAEVMVPETVVVEPTAGSPVPQFVEGVPPVMAIPVVHAPVPVVVAEATELVAPVADTAVTEEPHAEAVGGEGRLADLRRRLRVLVRENRTTVAKCAGKVGVSPKTLMSGDMTGEQVELLGGEVARAVKRGRAR